MEISVTTNCIVRELGPNTATITQRARHGADNLKVITIVLSIVTSVTIVSVITRRSHCHQLNIRFGVDYFYCQ